MELCGGTISVHKIIDDDGDLGTTGAQSDGVGWHFDASVDPPSTATSTPADGNTDGDGFVSVFLYVQPDTAGNTLPSLIGGFQVPFNPHTCAPQLNTVAQVPANGACGFPVADDY